MLRLPAIAVMLTILAFVPFVVCSDERAHVAPPDIWSHQGVASEAPAAATDVRENRRVIANQREESAPELPVVDRSVLQSAPQQTEETESLLMLRGRVTVLDPEGAEHFGENGTMQFHTLSRDVNFETTVTVENGIWSCEVPRNASLWIQALEIGGRGAVCDIDQNNPLPVPAQGFLSIYARWPPPSVLVVRAIDTGFDLDQLQVLGGLPFSEGTQQHPGRIDPQYVLDVPGRSPITLPSWKSGYQSEITLYVRSPGYGWGRIDLDQSLGGERLLMLAPGGDVLVSFRGSAVAAGSVLSIRSQEGGIPILELPLLDGRDFELGGLRAGHYQVLVQSGLWFESPVLLGASTVEVVPDRLSVVVVTLDEAPALQVASLSGKLVIPTDWDADRRYLFFDLLESIGGGRGESFVLSEQEMTLLADSRPYSASVYGWSRPEIRAGRWQIGTPHPPHAVVVDVLAGSHVEVVIEVPLPALVRLQILERGTDRVADLDRVFWRSYVLGSNGGVFIPVARSFETGVFEFQATIGTIVVTANSGEYERFRKTFEIKEGLNEYTAEAHGAIGVVIVLKDDSTVVPWSSDWNVHPERIDGARAGGWGSARIASGVRLTVSSPGLYRVAIPDIDGYLPVPPLEVQFAEGPHPTIEVPLIRAR